MLDDFDPLLKRLVPRLAEAPGVVAIVLGGSRARGTANPASDYDIGLYYESAKPLDTKRLLDLVRNLVDEPAAAAVTRVGDWGPRIIGGGWLTIDSRKVDLLYRGVEAVSAVISECRAGRISMDYQPGYPHGFCSSIWMGEVALCRMLYDPHGMLARMKASTVPYPEQLREALLRTFLWEILFSIQNAETAVARGEQTHIAGCVYRALCCTAQVLFALNRRYLINEKAALAEAAGLPVTLRALADRIGRVWGWVGGSEFDCALAELGSLDRELRALAGAAT